MSEKERFVVSTNTVGEIIVTDTETGKVYHYGSMSNFLGLIRLMNEQQTTINKLEQRDYYNQSERYKILNRAIELASEYIHRNDLEYYDFCALTTEFEKELLDNGK